MKYISHVEGIETGMDFFVTLQEGTVEQKTLSRFRKAKEWAHSSHNPECIVTQTPTGRFKSW